MRVDEVAWQKWHKYVTNVIDAIKGKSSGITIAAADNPTKQHEVWAKAHRDCVRLGSHGGNCKNLNVRTFTFSRG